MESVNNPKYYPDPIETVDTIELNDAQVVCSKCQKKVYGYANIRFGEWCERRHGWLVLCPSCDEKKETATEEG